MFSVLERRFGGLEPMKPGKVVKPRPGIRSPCFFAKCNGLGRDLIGDGVCVENNSGSRRNW